MGSEPLKTQFVACRRWDMTKEEQKWKCEVFWEGRSVMNEVRKMTTIAAAEVNHGSK